KSTSTLTIDREEWDFSECPREKVYFCYTYEFIRETLREVPAFIKRFDHAKPDDFDARGNWHTHVMTQPNERDEIDFFEIIDAPQGFPNQPYLKLDHCITD